MIANNIVMIPWVQEHFGRKKIIRYEPNYRLFRNEKQDG